MPADIPPADRPRFRHTHSRPVGDQICYWDVERLWKLAAVLPVEQLPVEQILEIDEDCWFCGDKLPTIRSVIEHCRRMQQADLTIPVLLHPDGRLIDGGHRAARAILEGRPTIPAQRFPQTPTPDATRPRRP